jgi:hypothetical protein
MFNAPIRRSFLYDVSLTFTNISPHIASLAFPALNDQTVAKVYKSNGQPVPQSQWAFTESSLGSGVFNQVLIIPEVFDANASYKIDYQSTSRTIQDALPFQDLREMLQVGDTESQGRYRENVHYRIPVSISNGITPNEDNDKFETRQFSSVDPDVANTGTETVTVSGTYTGDYSRRYELKITAVGATINGEVRITLTSGGNNVEPPSPIHPNLAIPTGQLVSFSTPGGTSADTITDPYTDDVITITLNDTSNSTTVNDKFVFHGYGPSLIELSTAVSNTNQFSEVSAVTKDVNNASADLIIRDDATYTGVANRKYYLECTAASGVSPNRTASFVWVGYGEHPVTRSNTTISISEASGSNLNVTLEDGIKVDFDFGNVQFTVGDTFTFTAKAAHTPITAKDSRDYTLTVQTAADELVVFQYVTNTPEGRFGIVETNALGSLRLPGGIDLYVRNVGFTAGQNRYETGDEWTFSTVDEEVVDWSLTSRTTETINTTEFLTDILGTVTGVVGATYVILTNMPSNLMYVKDTVTGSLLTATALSSQPIVFFTTAPSNNISVHYEYIGIEPAPGQLYYVTANIVRPLELYNVPLLSLSYQDAQRLLGPSATNNDLLIGAEIALNDNGAPGLYTCQAFDSDNDGVISTVDINTAIIATERSNKLTDVIVLNGNSSLSTALASNERMNDPFARKERALWVGLPVGTAIGDTDTAGTITYTAKRTLQVYGENPAHGKRVLMANNKAVKTITLSDGTSADVTLDGSFVQVAVAALNASFADPGTTLLRRNISGFKSIDVYSEPEELQLEAASVLYLSNQGSVDAPVYRIEESVTVDTSAPDNNEINVAINQKEFVTREIRDYMDSALIAIVPPSEQAGVAIVQAKLVTKLADMVSRGLIGNYVDDQGNIRALNPSIDVEVFRDTTDKTLYHFRYYWMGRYNIKRLFGMYSVDRQFWNVGA